MEDNTPDKCLCGCREFKPVLTGKYNRFGLKDYRFQIRKCKECGLARTFPYPDQETAYLPQQVYLTNVESKMEHSIENRFAENTWSKSVLTPLLKYISSGELLEIGCYDCKLLQEAKLRGFNVKGVEIQKEAAEFGRRKGFDVFHGNIFEAKYKDNSFDVVVAAHVLEHVYDVSSFLGEIHRITKNGGYLYICVPRHEGFLAKIMADHWAGWYPNQHYWHFSKSSLDAMVTGGNKFKLVYSTFKDSSECFSKTIKGLCKEFIKKTACFFNNGDAMRLIYKKPPATEGF